MELFCRSFLPVFDTVMGTGSISHAANEIGLMQLALSNSFARPRSELGNALIVHKRNGIQPTPFALSCPEPVASAVTLLDNAGEQASGFDPDRIVHSFTFAMSVT